VSRINAKLQNGVELDDDDRANIRWEGKVYSIYHPKQLL
jgi:hypothetical protein